MLFAVEAAAGDDQHGGCIEKLLGRVNTLKKNTAMAILYATAVIQNKHPQSVITSMPSDHYIKNISAFKTNIKTATRIAAGQNKLVVLGAKPTSANPSYGYINPGKKIDDGIFTIHLYF